MSSSLDGLIGTLEGTWKTYLRPDELYDEAGLTMQVAKTDGGYLISYEGPIKEDDVTGSMLVSDDGSSIAWTDSWHTEAQEQHLIASDGGRPSYQYGPEDEPWTWSIDIRPGNNKLEIIHYNAPPGLDGVVAVVMDVST